MTPYVAVGISPTTLKRYMAENIVKDSEEICADIVAIVCDLYQISVTDIVSPSRKREFAEARQIVMYLLYKYTNMGVIGIGRFLKRHYTSVIYGRDNVKDLMDVNALFAAKINQIENMI